MKFILAFLAIAFAFVGNAAQAKSGDIACTGSNLFAKMRAQDPAAADALLDKVAKVPFSEGILWKVEAEGVEPSYLFGTMHISDPRLLDLPPKAQEALDAADTVALEIAEIVNPQALAAQAASLMEYTGYLDGTSLDDRMTAEEVALVKPLVAEKMGLPWNVASKLRPGTLMGMLSLPACELARKQAGKPFLDMSLGQQAQAGGKELVGLETLESQLKILSSLPEPLLIRSLVQSAQYSDAMDDLFETMVVQYEKGRIGLIWAMMQELAPEGADTETYAKDYAEFQRVMVDQRNVTMADESEKLIRQGAAFIAVGALHLPGEKGLANILAERGYRVTKP